MQKYKKYREVIHLLDSAAGEVRLPRCNFTDIPPDVATVNGVRRHCAPFDGSNLNDVDYKTLVSAQERLDGKVLRLCDLVLLEAYSPVDISQQINELKDGIASDLYDGSSGVIGHEACAQVSRQMVRSLKLALSSTLDRAFGEFRRG
jgi:hypothetical protein